MSMTRDDLSRRRPLTLPTDDGCARFIGRVGTLAVALGIGAAVASSPGVAWADDDESASSATTSSSSSGVSQSSKSSASHDGAAKANSLPAHASTSPQSANTTDSQPETTDDDPVTDPSTEPSADSPSKPVSDDEVPEHSKPNKPHRTSSRKLVDHSQDTEQRTAVKAIAADSVEAEPPVTADDTEPAQLATASFAKVAAAHTVATLSDAPAAAQTKPPAHPATVVAEAVSSLLSVVGLSPLATGGAPVPPPQSPTLWAMLGWVRREVGHVSEPATARSAAETSMSLVQPTASLTATSVLGTGQQLTAEQIAAQTFDTLPVQLAKLILRSGFLSAAQQQFSLVGGPDQDNIDQLNNAVDEYAMGAAFQQQILDSMNPTVVMQVAPPHTWYGQDVDGSRILYDNPDTIYRFMGVNGASSYVITGRFDGDMPADTTFSVLTGLTGNTAYVLTKDQLKLDPDGHSFTITADSTPADGRDNHLQLTAETTLIAARNTLSDWTNEQPMSLEITRVGGPPASLFSQLGGFAIPGLGPAVVSNPLLTALVSLVPPLPYVPPLLRGAFTAVIMALGIQRESTYMAVATTDPETGELRPPNELKNPTRNAEFLATQLQSAGYFQLADDEALVVTIDPGSAGYFVVPVTNDWTITGDYWNEQTSLNKSQAIVNEDKTTYTIVISKTDPHIANWVSTGGLNQGTISIRFQDLDTESEDLPTVRSQVVKLDKLCTVLPEGTVYYDDDQRAEQLAIRKAGYDNRFAPYPQPGPTV